MPKRILRWANLFRRFGPKHFLFPFLAHAFGAFVGTFLAYVAAGSRRDAFAYPIGSRFLAGGITVGFMLPAPGWFMAADLVGAYLPRAWLATHLDFSLITKSPIGC